MKKSPAQGVVPVLSGVASEKTGNDEEKTRNRRRLKNAVDAWATIRGNGLSVRTGKERPIKIEIEGGMSSGHQRLLRWPLQHTGESRRKND